MLYRGYAYDENIASSFMTHQESAKKGNPDAMLELCIYYNNRIGVDILFEDLGLDLIDLDT